MGQACVGLVGSRSDPAFISGARSASSDAAAIFFLLQVPVLAQAPKRVVCAARRDQALELKISRNCCRATLPEAVSGMLSS